MEVWKKLLILLLNIYSVLCQLGINYGIGEAINITFQGMTLFAHTPENPVFHVGEGMTEYSEEQGSFIVNDTTISKIKMSMTPKAPQLYDNGKGANFTSQSSDGKIEVFVDLYATNVETNDDASLTLSARITKGNNIYNRIWMSFAAESMESERVYGGGEQYSYLNLRGYDFPIFTTEQGVGRDDSLLAGLANNGAGGAGGDYFTTYWPQANYLATKSNGDKYSFMLENRNYLVLDFTQNYTNQIFSHSTSLTGNLLYSTSIKRLVSSISQVVGRQPLLPDWIMKGAILGLQNGMEEVNKNYEMARAAKVDIAALWIQDWSGAISTDFGHRVYWGWEWDEEYYPGLDDFIDTLEKENIYVTAYCNMHLINSSDLYMEGDEMGYFMTDDSGDTFLQDFGEFYCGTVDLLNEDARNWYAERLTENMIHLGFKGWMADFGEYTRMDMFSNNTHDYTAEEVHNLIPVAWAETNRKMLTDSDTLGSNVFWTRSGGLGSGKYTTLAWNGDQNVDFSEDDGLPSTIVGTLSLALSGIGLCHFDIGGYTTFPSRPINIVRTQELLIRSAEYAVFTPVMRTHEGNRPEENEQFYSSTDTILKFARLTQIHSKLFNYTKKLVTDNAQFGYPVQRPMFYDFENDDVAMDMKYQYMFGPDLIVAPVIKEGQSVVPIYVPGGDASSWIHIWGGIGGPAGPFEGPATIDIIAPMGFPAVLYRNNSEWVSLFEEIEVEFGISPP